MKIKNTDIQNIPNGYPILKTIGLTFIGLIAVSIIGGCANRKESRSEIVVMEDSIPLPEDVVTIVKAISQNDAKEFASHAVYPIERPYPLKNIEDSAQMVAYYPVMVDDSLKKVVDTATRTDWSEAGWRGWTLDAGQYFWISDGIYAIPYLSKREKAMLKKERQRDLETLPEDLRPGWTPLFCLHGIDDNTLYRIDSDSINHEYRMMVYPGGKRLKERPGRIYKGKMETQGSEENRVYEFGDGDTVIEISEDDTGEGIGMMYITKGKKPVSKEVEPAYWLDYTE